MTDQSKATGFDADDYREIREEKVRRNIESRSTNTLHLTIWCKENGIDCKRISDYQFRLKFPFGNVDIYPTSNKYHNLSNRQRGYISQPLTTFLTHIKNNW